jgi:hypothetical protein
MRRIALLLFPLLLLGLAACGDDSGNGDNSPTSTSEPTAVQADTAPTDEATATEAGASSGSGAGAVLGAFNPLTLLSSAGQVGAGQPDPSLSSVLIQPADLPASFSPAGDFSNAFASEFGDAQMAANIFVSGDLASANFDAIVMSAALLLPQEALDELGDPAELSKLTDADLEPVRDSAGELGSLYRDLRVLDASGLGDGGTGMHIALDFGALLGVFGATEENSPFAEGISIDTYMFMVGDRMLVTLVMSPGSQGPSVDARALAETMESRA